MRTYVVKDGDSQASIAARDEMAGCPKCGGAEFVRANPHKKSIVRPNGFRAFESLVPGEILNLPDAWFHPARDLLPPTYYKILPHPDGVTRGSLGDAPGSLPDLDTAVAAVARLAALGDAEFVQAVGDAGAKVDAVVNGVSSTGSADAVTKARAVTDATQWSWRRNRDLTAAVAANDRATVTRARLDIQNALATALGNARLAIHSSPSPASSDLQAAAKAAVLAISADPNYCTSVTHAGTPVNAAVHRFKLAWNASQSPKVPVGTGTYETATTVALAQVNGSAPSACGAGQRPIPAPKPPPPLPSKKEETITAPSDDDGWSTWTIAGVTVLGVVAAGGIAFLATRDPKSPVLRREAM